MSNKPLWGLPLALAWLFGVLALGVYLPEVEPGETEIWEEGEFGDILPTKHRIFIEDQLKTRRITKKSRRLKTEFNMIMEDYKELPPFEPPPDGHLTQEMIDNFKGAYYLYVSQLKHLKKNIVGKSPSFFRVLALYGMVDNYDLVSRMNSFVQYNITEEEWQWTRYRIFEAALYCVQYKLDHENPTGEEKQRLEDLRDGIYEAAGIKERDQDRVMHFYPERIRLRLIPRTNIGLFLDNYMEINFPQVHFDRPTVIEFDREAILREAAKNPL